MSALLEWLWPLEDEEAVQEAERLIEETNNTLKQMEADMRVQRISGQHLSQQTEKLKSIVNNKIDLLEKELKTLSEPTASPSHHHMQHSSDDCKKSKLTSKDIEGYGKLQQVLNLPASHLEKCPNVNVGSDHSLKKQGRNVFSKKKTSTAEKVVLTARAKVQDALTVARNVSASLGAHVPASSLHSKPVSCPQIHNIGIFDVKSQAEEKTAQDPKKRLGQTALPSISIKRGLEKQSIPSIQVAPGEKLVAANVSVFNMKYDNEGVSSQQSVNLKDKNYQGNSQYRSVEHQTGTASSYRNSGLEGAFAQLSKQLAEVEELREVNQTQVNHVLRFLLSRVCVTTPPPERSAGSTVSQEKECKLESKDVSPRPKSTSTSESSQYPIVYDSLSRFLETYKQAAEQSMLARKRAAVRRQKVAVHQREEIHKAQTSTENHLLIGPLRHTAKLKEASKKQVAPEVQDSMESFSIPSSFHEQVNFSVNESNANSVTQVSNDNDAQNVSTDGEKIGLNSPFVSPTNSNDSSLLFPVKPPGTVSGEEYEDDWEEEENPNLSVKQDGVKVNLEDSFLIPIIEAEETISSSSQSENQKSTLLPHSADVIEAKTKTLNVNFSKSLPMTTHPEGKISKEQAKQLITPVLVEEEPLPASHNEEVDIVHWSTQTNQREDILKCKGDSGKLQPVEAQFIKGSSLSGNDSAKDSDEHTHKKSHEKTTSGTHSRTETKGKQYQTLRRRTQARFHSQHSSSSDSEMTNNFKTPLRNLKRLNLREDLQLQSAILLNWQMEERFNKKKSEVFPLQNQTVPPVQHCEIPADVERHWQRSLDQLDLRLKSIEENERIHRIANEIRLKSGQEPPRDLVNKEVKNVTESFIIGVSNNARTKDQMVQTSPKIGSVPLSGKTFERLLVPTQDLKKVPRVPKPFMNSDDLTAELLTYSRLGTLPKVDLQELPCSRSSSSSTTSSHLHHSSNIVSLSDGELQDSVGGSCSCSEGEFCVCGGRKLCSERAPPDGSQTSEGENFIKDVSQGEIPLNEVKHILQDTSFGEIADCISTGMQMEDSHGADEESMEWEL